MPNRIIKESICTSETLNQLTDLEENLFYKLIVNCDDYGRFDARPNIIKSRCYPLRDRLTLKTLEDALSSLARVGCVKLYIVDGKPYLYLPAWRIHQQVRATKSKYPAPDGIGKQLISDNSGSNQVLPDAPVFENEYENDNEHCVDDYFESAWQLYPKKKGKGQISATQKKKLFKLGDELLRAINRYVDDLAVKGTQAQYVMYGSTFFNSGYIDYLDSNYQQDKGVSKMAPHPIRETGYINLAELVRDGNGG